MRTIDWNSVKKATGRALIALCRADKPLTLVELGEAIAKNTQKKYSDRELAGLKEDLLWHDWVYPEGEALMHTSAGLRAFQQLEQNKEGWAKKFYTPTESPNYDLSTAEGVVGQMGCTSSSSHNLGVQ